MNKKISILFDSQINYGSKEHFFHFLWGYILPSIHLIHTDNNKNERKYCFETCGPIMDRITQEVIDLFSLPATILSKHDFNSNQEIQVVPRWDVYLLKDYILDIEQSIYSHIQEFKTHIPLKKLLNNTDFKSNFLTQILEVKNLFINKISNSNHYKGVTNENRMILINRSQMPVFYSNEGNAEIKGYGLSRRGLVDIDKFIESAKDIDITVFEPGSHTFMDQIRIFSSASSVIGIKGAEFANLLWMKENSKVFLIKPEDMNTPPVQQKLAELLNLTYIEIVSKEGKYPSLLTIELNKYL